MISSLNPMKFDNKNKIIKITGRGATINPETTYFLGISGIECSKNPQNRHKNTIPKLNNAPAIICMSGADCIVNSPPKVRLIAVISPNNRVR